MEELNFSNILDPEQIGALFSEDRKEDAENEGGEEITASAPIESEKDGPPQSSKAQDSSSVTFPPSSSSEGSVSEDNEKPDKVNKTGVSTWQLLTEALRDEGIYSDLTDDDIKKVNDAEAFRRLIDNEINRRLSERQRKIENLATDGASSQDISNYDQLNKAAAILEDANTVSALGKDDKDGENARRTIILQDFLSRGFKEEKAKSLTENSFTSGTDKEDAEEARQSLIRNLRDKIAHIEEGNKQKKLRKEQEDEQQAELLKTTIISGDFMDGAVTLSKDFRQRAFDAAARIAWTDPATGRAYTQLGKYQKEHSMDFIKNVALLFQLTDGFKTLNPLIQRLSHKATKSGFKKLEQALNTTRRTSDGILNFANDTADDDDERAKWTLAI